MMQVRLFEKRDLMRQSGSPGGIRQIKVNCVSEIAPVRSAVNSWVLHVQVERLADRRKKSAQKHRDTKQRAAEEGCCPRRLYAHSSRTHCLRLGLVHQSSFFVLFFKWRSCPKLGRFQIGRQKLETSGGLWLKLHPSKSNRPVSHECSVSSSPRPHSSVCPSLSRAHAFPAHLLVIHGAGSSHTRDKVWKRWSL